MQQPTVIIYVHGFGGRKIVLYAYFQPPPSKVSFQKEEVS